MVLQNNPPKKLEALYKSLFDNTPDGVAYCQMIFDAQSRPVDWVHLKVNKNFEKLIGSQNVERKNAAETIPKSRIDNPKMLEIFGRVSLTGQTERFETYIEPLSSWFLIYAYSLEKGVFVAVFQNITEQKTIEQDLMNAKVAARNVLEDLEIEKKEIAEAKAKYEAILENLGEGVLAIDFERRVLFINKKGEDLLGWKEKDLIGKVINSLPLEDAEGHPIPLEKRPTYIAMKENKNVITNDYFFVREDKTKFPIYINIAPITLEKKITGAIVIFKDISKEKELDRAKSEFISIASHQLRTPVSGLNWLTEALQFTSGNLDPKQKTYVKDLSTLAKRLVALVEDLLNISRVDLKTTIVTEKSLVDVAVFIEEFIKEIESYANSKKHAIIFNKNIVGPIITEINKKSLYNVLQNLVSNAIEYSPENTGVTINLEQASNFIKVSISNKGPAIPKDEQPHIFARFYRGESAKKIKAEGTGLGLYIIKMIIGEMGGKVGFESEEGKDTMFWFTIPLKT